MKKNILKIFGILALSSTALQAMEDNSIQTIGLSLEGEGAEVMVCATALREIETRTKSSIYELFDVVGGTSMGGLLAAAAVGPYTNITPMHDLVELLRGSSAEIFDPIPYSALQELGTDYVRSFAPRSALIGGGAGAGRTYINRKFAREAAYAKIDAKVNGEWLGKMCGPDLNMQTHETQREYDRTKRKEKYDETSTYGVKEAGKDILISIGITFLTHTLDWGVSKIWHMNDPVPVRPRYKAEPLEALLINLLEDAELKNTSKRLLIPVIDTETGNQVLFDSDVAREKDNKNYDLTSVVRATLSNPAYFDPVLIRSVNNRSSGTFKHGGPAASNATDVVLEKLLELNPRKSRISLLSLGVSHLDSTDYNLDCVSLTAGGILNFNPKIGDIWRKGDNGPNHHLADLSIGDRFVRKQVEIAAGTIIDDFDTAIMDLYAQKGVEIVDELEKAGYLRFLMDNRDNKRPGEQAAQLAELLDDGYESEGTGKGKQKN